MRHKKSSQGFSIIELLLVILFMNIIAAVVITVYVGIKDKVNRGKVLSIAVSSKTELHHWLESSISQKQYFREVDTDFSGALDNNDTMNGDLYNNVAEMYVKGRNTLKEEMSPWFDIPLWNPGPSVPGTISVIQSSPRQINLVATEKNGQVIVNDIIRVE